MKDVLLQWLTGGGIMVVIYILCRVGLWIVRKTETKVDDKIIDNYVTKAIEFALQVMPKDSTVNWVKFTANALGQFTTAYTKEQGEEPDTTTWNKAKALIEEVANNIEFKNLTDALKECKLSEVK